MSSRLLTVAALVASCLALAHLFEQPGPPRRRLVALACLALALAALAVVVALQLP